MYKNYIKKFVEEPGTTVPLQLLHDWRAVTGFVSGQDLFEIISNYVNGRQYGEINIDVKDIDKNSIFFRQAKKEARTSETFLGAALYYEKTLDFGIEGIKNADDVEQLRQMIWQLFGSGPVSRLPAEDEYESAVIENGSIVCRGCKLDLSSNPATNEHGYEIGLSWEEVMHEGGAIWVSEDGQPHVDPDFSAAH